MSRRRRKSRRKSSSGSKQSISTFNFQKNRKVPVDDVGLKDEQTEKGEADSLHKENCLCKSDTDEENHTQNPCTEKRFGENDTQNPCTEKRFGEDSYVGCFKGNAKSPADSLSDDKTSQQDQGVRITTSVTVDDLEQNTSKVVYQRSYGSGTLGSASGTIAVTTTKLKGIHANMRIEIRELLQVDDSDYKTTLVLHSQKVKDTEASSESQRYGFHVPNNEPFTYSHPWNPRADLNDGKTAKPFDNLSCELSVFEMSKEGADMPRHPVPTTCCCEGTDCYQRCCQDRCYGYGHLNRGDTDFALVDGLPSRSTPSGIWSLRRRLTPGNSITSVTQLDVPPPEEFADTECEGVSVNDLSENVAACHISTYDEVDDPGESASVMMFGASSFKRDSTTRHESMDWVRSDDMSFENESELDPEELSTWPDAPMSRSSFTKNFIYKHKRKTCMRNNSIAILESSTPPAGYLNMPKRRKTFPAVLSQPSDPQDDIPMCRESFSSGTLSPFFTQSLPREGERSGRFYLEDDSFSPIFTESRKSSEASGHLSSTPVRAYNVFSPKHSLASECDAGVCDRGAQELSVVEEADPESGSGSVQEQSEITESGFEEEVVDMPSNAEDLSPSRAVPSKDPFIHITPPSPGSSRGSDINGSHDAERPKEHESDVGPQVQSKESAGEIRPKSRKGSVTTVMMVGCEQRMLRSHSTDSAPSEKSHRDVTSTVSEAPGLHPIADADQMEEDGGGAVAVEMVPQARLTESRTSIQSLSLQSFEVTDLQSDSNHSLRSPNTSQDIETKEEAAADKQREQYYEIKPKNKRSFHTLQRPVMQPVVDTARRHSCSRIPSEIKERLKLPSDVLHKDPEEAPDHWARRRKLFKEGRQSSAGASSIASNITDDSDMVSEEARPVEVTVQDIEDRGFYTETFHCTSWIYHGDDASPSESPRCLSKRPKPVTIRERTIKITKGFGEYPWGFRIQFSKPIVVTEVDTNGAAEEAGLLVGDYVHSVNGKDVTNAPHSEAADLARQGPDLLTLVIGSDIGRAPNTPRPACRGYLHKRTQSSLIRGWRQRWFVLRHDCCLYYYRHKRDEGKSQALCRVQLEGAEVEADSSLGKPFVFKCSPVSGGRAYHFCTTSNQDMKRWLEAMSQAVHPVPPNHVWVDVTRHNASLPALAVKTPECLGLLHQLDRTKDAWEQNYCILKDGCLYFYASIRSTNALGGIYLQGYSVREQPIGPKRSSIELRPPSDEFKTFQLCAENVTENKRWILAIRASISKWVPLHQAIQAYMSKPPEETRM